MDSKDSATGPTRGHRPTVTVSYAQTLDGRLATRSGSSRWISGPESLRFAHELRAGHDAIMVGAGTVRRDDPRLTVRLVPGHDPLRVIVDSTLSTPLTAAVLADGAALRTVIAATDRAPGDRRDAIRAMGATVLIGPSDAAGRVDLPTLLAALGEQGLGSLMVEGGARLITTLLRARLVDRLVVCIAPMVLGAGIEAVGDLGISDLGQAVRLVDVAVKSAGVDLIIDGRARYPEDRSGL